jgi:hypothetical protein
MKNESSPSVCALNWEAPAVLVASRAYRVAVPGGALVLECEASFSFRYFVLLLCEPFIVAFAEPFYALGYVLWLRLLVRTIFCHVLMTR